MVQHIMFLILNFVIWICGVTFNFSPQSNCLSNESSANDFGKMAKQNVIQNLKFHLVIHFDSEKIISYPSIQDSTPELAIHKCNELCF